MERRADANVYRECLELCRPLNTMPAVHPPWPHGQTTDFTTHYLFIKVPLHPRADLNLLTRSNHD